MIKPVGARERGVGPGLALALLLGAALIIAIYWPGLRGPLLFDDFQALKPLLEQELAPDANWRSRLLSDTGALGRPVAMASFMLNVRMWGSDVGALKSVNLALHLVNALVLFLFTRRLLGAMIRAPDRQVTVAALGVALLWAVHPLQVSTVLYTVQRMTQLSALFCLLGLWAYLCGRTAVAPGWAHRLALASPFLLFTPLAVLSKENGILLPGFVLLLEVLLPQRPPHASEWQVRWQLRLGAWVPLLLVGLFLASGGWERILAGYAGRGFDLTERLLTQARVLVLYLGMVVAPATGKLGFFHDDLELSRGLLAPVSTLYSVVALAALGGLVLLLRRRQPAAAFGVAFFLCGHLVESTVIPLEMMFEHRNYSPSSGILLALGALLLQVRSPVIRRLGLVTAGLTGALFAGLTAMLAADWSSEPTMYANFYRAHPFSPHAASHFAQVLSAQGHYQAARKLLVPVGGFGAEVQRWYLSCAETGRLDDAVVNTDLLDRERILRSYPVVGLIEVANLALDGKCQISLPRLEAVIARAVALPAAQRQWRNNLLFYLAHLRWARQHRLAALEVLAELSRAQTDDPLPYLLMAEWKLEMGDRAGAEAAFAAGKRISESSGRDYSALVRSVEALLEKK